MGNQLTVPSGSSWYVDDFSSMHLKDYKSIYDGTFSLSFRLIENQEMVAVKAFQLSGKYDRSIAQTFCNIYKDKSKIISQYISGNYISTPILTKNGAYLKRPYFDMPLTEQIDIDSPLEYIEKKWIALQLLHAIRNLHKINFFHGDIKPENVLLSSNLNVHLTDHAPFKPQYISQNQPHYFIHFFSYGRPCAYLAPERITLDLSSSPELQKEQTMKAMLAIKAITTTLRPNMFRNGQKSSNSKSSQSNQTNIDNNFNKSTTYNEYNRTNTEKSKSNGDSNTFESLYTEEYKQKRIEDEINQAQEALNSMQAADLFSIGCVLAFIFTGKSLFDFTSLVQYGHYNDNNPLKILNKITDTPIHDLILKLIDRDQKKRLEAINNFESSFPSWMNDFYYFYVGNVIGTRFNQIPDLLSTQKLHNILPSTIGDDIIIYLNIISCFFLENLKISTFIFLIRHFEHFSFHVTSRTLKILRLLPTLLFLLSPTKVSLGAQKAGRPPPYVSPTILTVALDSFLNIVRSIDRIDDIDDDMVKSFSDIFFIPSLLSVMDPKNNRQINEKVAIISRIPSILVVMQRLWPTIVEKLPMRTEFILPMLQASGRDSLIDESKLNIVRYFLSSGRTVTYTKSYSVFKALYMILFQMLNCSAYVPLIVEFVMAFLRELRHSDKIRFYKELFPPFQGILLSYVTSVTKDGSEDDVIIIFDAFATMIETGAIKVTSASMIASAVFRHITSISDYSRAISSVLLKKLPIIYQRLDILPIVCPQQITQPPAQPIIKRSANLERSKANNKSVFIKQQQPPLATPSKSSKSSRNTIYMGSSSGTKKKGRKSSNTAMSIPLFDVPLDDAKDCHSPSIEKVEIVPSNSLSAIKSSSPSSGSSVHRSSSNSSIENSSGASLPQMSLSAVVDPLPGGSKSRSPSFGSQLRTSLYASTKISPSEIQRILIVHNKNDECLETVVLHSSSTVICYKLNINTKLTKSSSPVFEGKMIEHSWIYTFQSPVLSIDKSRDGLVISLPNSIIKRSNGQTKSIYEPKKSFTKCRMIAGNTMATVIDDRLFTCDIEKNFEIKGSYFCEPSTSVRGIYRWESMGDNFFAFTTLNGRLYVVDDRAGAPIFSSDEHGSLSDVVLLPRFQYAVTDRCGGLGVYRFSGERIGSFARPTFKAAGQVDSAMAVSNALLMLNQYGTFLYNSNNGACLSLNDKNRISYMRPNSDTNVHRNNGSVLHSAVYESGCLLASPQQAKVRSVSTCDIGQSKSDLGCPVLELPKIGWRSLHGHSFQITACDNTNAGAVCISGDAGGYMNIWSVTQKSD